ncbi:hypothetical protein FFWV33_00545 [Flavobacterium faecale]|uniref:DUF4595 domain-containing protein n=1 Tax=Flavobacterium faecale TaxID=1355330 RepID=A0A2S1L8N1_9FLAO|nr:hypothetical protein [Flavobacterium faecale]AWG20112.1 hypothetical protein FFWV33_00545 [Flavobacterium faecale]
MRNNRYIFWLITSLFFAIVGCTSDSENQTKLIKNVVETSDSGTVQTTNYTYNGTQLMAIESPDTLKEFTYDSGYITAIVTTDKVKNEKSLVNYTYESGFLKRVELGGSYYITYTQNADNTVSYQKMDTKAYPLETKIYHGTLKLKDGNMLSEERILDNSAGVISKYTVSYEYDSKTNPLHNIEGYDKLWDHEGIISNNNYLISTVETTVESNGQIISSATYYKNNFKYDKASYPVEKNSLMSIPHKGISISLNTVYNY